MEVYFALKLNAKDKLLSLILQRRSVTDISKNRKQNRNTEKQNSL